MIYTRTYGDGWKKEEVMAKNIDLLDEKVKGFHKTETYKGTFGDINIEFRNTNPQGQMCSIIFTRQDGEQIINWGSVNPSRMNARSRIRIAESKDQKVLLMEFQHDTKLPIVWNDRYVVISGDTSYVATSYGQGAPYDVFYQNLYNVSTLLRSHKTINRLQYVYSDEKIEIIENKTIVEGDDFRESIPSLLDCSQVEAQNMYKINGKHYYSVNTNTLIEVDMEV